MCLSWVSAEAKRWPSPLESRRFVPGSSPSRRQVVWSATALSGDTKFRDAFMSSTAHTHLMPLTNSSEGSSLVGVKEWQLKRNCSMSPRGAALAYALLCVFSLAVALGFLAVGVGIVLIFSGLELLAVGLAWLVWGRRVGIGERVCLHGAVLHVHSTATRASAQPSTHEFPAAWTRVIEERSQVVLSCGARRLGVGSQAPWQHRAAFARELRHALASPANF